MLRKYLKSRCTGVLGDRSFSQKAATCVETKGGAGVVLACQGAGLSNSVSVKATLMHVPLRNWPYNVGNGVVDTQRAAKFNRLVDGYWPLYRRQSGKARYRANTPMRANLLGNDLFMEDGMWCRQTEQRNEFFVYSHQVSD